MDEKFLELRSKLDFARESSVKKVQKAEKIARELRLKFALGFSGMGRRGTGTGTGSRNVNGTCTGVGNSESVVLDKIILPDIYSSGIIGENINGYE